MTGKLTAKELTTVNAKLVGIPLNPNVVRIELAAFITVCRELAQPFTGVKLIPTCVLERVSLFVYGVMPIVPFIVTFTIATALQTYIGAVTVNAWNDGTEKLIVLLGPGDRTIVGAILIDCVAQLDWLSI